MAANTDDFLGEGTASSAFAPQKSPQQIEEEEEAERQRRRDEVRWADNSTAVNNAGYVRNGSRERGYDVATADDPYDTGKTYVSDAWVQQHHQRIKDHQRGFVGNLVRDPVTMAVLAAPWLVTGAGALAPAATAAPGGSAALAAPYGAGGAYGASVPGGLAAAHGVAAAPAITTGAASVAPTLAAPAAAGAAGTTAAASAFTPSNIIAGAGAITSAGMLIKDLMPNGAEEKLKRTQAKLAAEAQQRQQQMHDQQMNALGQQLLAFSPQNQLMAQMFGPQAAFTPQQFQQMGQDPSTRLQNYQGTDPAMQKQVQASIQANGARQQALGAMPGLPPPKPHINPVQVQQQRKF